MRFGMRSWQCYPSRSLPRLPWRKLRSAMPASLSDSSGPAHRLRPRLDITHRPIDGVVPGDVPQRKGVRMLPRLGQKRVAQSVEPIFGSLLILSRARFSGDASFPIRAPAVPAFGRVAWLAEPASLCLRSTKRRRRPQRLGKTKLTAAGRISIQPAAVCSRRRSVQPSAIGLNLGTWFLPWFRWHHHLSTPRHKLRPGPRGP